LEADSWKTIKGLLQEALPLDPTARAAFLDRAGITAKTRAEVESLLALEVEAGDFMSVTAGEFSGDIFASGDGDALLKQRIGAYEIVSELGYGGMGAVYLAERADGKFEQTVAVKMLRREFNTERLRRTFTREKDILAALSHPNIARLLDAGSTTDGIPYLAMEYVRGEPLDKFCQSRGLSLDERLELFGKVCEAVAYAHRNLVVHRDIKPGNILVNEDGEPKLLDFGISKLLGADRTDGAGVTQLGALTPLYASPEQVRGEPVTTASDVYSLGVVLFKVLTEDLPYRAVEKTNGDLLREITESAPRLPSAAAQATVTTSQLKGDLDNIILKSLSKEPERRYQTVEEFSADLQRFAEGMPVLARPATLTYRARKFYGRNKVSVWAAALILISLFAGIIGALWQARAARIQARIASEARAAAELETARARNERDRAEKTSRFMQSFLNYANPHWSGLGSRDEGRTDFTVREALQDVVTRMDTELADSPEVRADLHYTIGEVYAGSGDGERAAQHLRQSLQLYRQVHGDEHPKVARGLYYVMFYETDLQKAEAQLRQGVLIMRRTDPENANLPHMVQTLGERIAKAERESRNPSRLAEAERLILEAKALFTRQHGEDHPTTISTNSSLARIALVRGDLVRAESLTEEVLRHFQQRHPGSYEHIMSLVYVGEVKLRQAKEADAETFFQQALELARRHWSAHDYRIERLVNYINQARAAAR
jgi:eukaryotic-like serine/threonine-protein kinase